MTRIPGLGRLWKPVTLPIGGDGYTVSQTDMTPHFPPDPTHIIPSCRLIMDVGQWDNSLAALPGGQSGHPASPHYQDSIADWQNGRYHPLLFSRARVEAAAQGSLTLEPGVNEEPTIK
jgi:penicillin amidase